jgi:hypothetical protein
MTDLGSLVSVYLNLIQIKKPNGKLKKVIAAIEDKLLLAADVKD